MKRRKSDLVLPAGVPREARIPTNARHGSFFWRYAFDDSDTRDITFDCHALIIAASGGMIIDTEEHSIFLEEGSAVVIGGAHSRIAGEALGEMHLFLFNNDVVRKHLRNRVIEARMVNASPIELAPAPIRHFYPAIAAQTKRATVSYPQCLAEILHLLMHDWAPAAAHSYFRKAYFGPRMRMCLALERGLLDQGKIDDDFQQRFRALHRTTPQQWLSARQSVLADYWLRHGEQKLEDIADVFACTKADFEQSFGRHQKLAPADVQRLHDGDCIAAERLAEEIRPAWLPPTADLPDFPLPQHLQGYFNSLEFTGEEVAAMPKIQSVIDPAAISNFWAMKSTGIGNIVALPPFLRTDPLDSLAAAA